jgi:hypothetical protein
MLPLVFNAYKPTVLPVHFMAVKSGLLWQNRS